MDKKQLNKTFLVAGCGGLGCFIVEGLLRLGVKKIIVCDPDAFSKSNLNRQLYSLPSNIGKYKVDVAKKRAKALEYKGIFVAYKTRFNKDMLVGVDVVIDALDNIKSRLELEDACEEYGITLIHGAVEEDTYQVGICPPGSKLLHNIYKDIKEPKKKKTNVITVEACAAKELALAFNETEEYFECFSID